MCEVPYLYCIVPYPFYNLCSMNTNICGPSLHICTTYNIYTSYESISFINFLYSFPLHASYVYLLCPSTFTYSVHMK